MIKLGLIPLISYSIAALIGCAICFASFAVGFWVGKNHADKNKGNKGDTNGTRQLDETLGDQKTELNDQKTELNENHRNSPPQQTSMILKEVSNKTTSDKQETTSKKGQKRQKRHEERLTKVKEESKTKPFDPKSSKPEDAIYKNLAVSNKRLVPCEQPSQTPYYHYWEYEGQLFFEFNCEPSKLAKAVNNRSAIINPFCQKDSNSSEDQSKSIKTVTFGELDKDLKVISKSIISYR